MITDLKITTLVDNNTQYASRYWSEHGLSILIEADGEKILFDTGQTWDVLGHNLGQAGIDISDLGSVVLSHGHYDHTGGLKGVLETAPNAKVLAHPDVFDEKYGRRNDEFIHIGIPFDLDEIRERHKLDLTREPVEIVDGVRTTGQIPRTSPFEPASDIFYIKKDDRFVKEELLDDQALILETGKGIWVVLGCCHSGLINTLDHVLELTGTGTIAGIIGGTHLIGADKVRLERTLEHLKALKIGSIGLSHCTGTEAFLYLSNELGSEIVFQNHVGFEMEI